MKGAPAAFLVLYLGLRAVLLLEPGYNDDIVAYRRWAMTAVEHGLPRLYVESDFDYPPLYAYALLPLGKAYAVLSPGAGTRRGGDHAVWVALAKLPPLVFDLLIGALLWRLGAAYERAGGAPWRLLLPGAYLANPAVVFDTGYWGHPDSIHSFFVLLAFALAAQRRGAPAFTSLTLATLMKPLGAPFFPLLAAIVFWDGGVTAVFGGIAAAALTTLVAFLPFVREGGASFIASRVIGDLDRMPYTSVNAHNLWGLLGGWRNAEEPWIGPLTASQIGLALFAFAYVALLAVARRWRFEAGGLDATRATTLAAGVAAAFFLLATHMHENHLFVVVPLLAATLPSLGRLRGFFVLLSLVVLLNLALHDPGLASSWPLGLGGDTGVPRLSHGRNFFGVELLAVRAATLLSVASLVGFLVSLLRREAPPLALDGPASDDAVPWR